MSEDSLQNLSRRERQIMDLLFKNGDMSARDVTDKLADAPSYTTVRTLMRILEEKGHLSHHTEGRQYIYQTVVQPEKERNNRLNHILKTFFSGSITEAVATFINQPDTNLSGEEIEELEALIKQAKKGN